MNRFPHTSLKRFFFSTKCEINEKKNKYRALSLIFYVRLNAEYNTAIISFCLFRLRLTILMLILMKSLSMMSVYWLSDREFVQSYLSNIWIIIMWFITTPSPFECLNYMLLKERWFYIYRNYLKSIEVDFAHSWEMNNKYNTYILCHANFPKNAMSCTCHKVDIFFSRVTLNKQTLKSLSSRFSIKKKNT